MYTVIYISLYILVLTNYVQMNVFSFTPLPQREISRSFLANQRGQPHDIYTSPHGLSLYSKS